MNNDAIALLNPVFEAIGVATPTDCHYYGLFDEDLYTLEDEIEMGGADLKRELKAIGVERCVDGKYGGEGEGEYCYGVISVKDAEGNTRYLKAEWSYYSYSQCDYDCIESTIREVVPVEQTVVVYENLNS